MQSFCEEKVHTFECVVEEQVYFATYYHIIIVTAYVNWPDLGNKSSSVLICQSRTLLCGELSSCFCMMHQEVALKVDGQTHLYILQLK